MHSACMNVPWNRNASVLGSFPSFLALLRRGAHEVRSPAGRMWPREGIFSGYLSLPHHPHHSNEGGRRLKSKYDLTNRPDHFPIQHPEQKIGLPSGSSPGDETPSAPSVKPFHFLSRDIYFLKSLTSVRTPEERPCNSWTIILKFFCDIFLGQEL